MSIIAVRAALEAALNAMSPALATAFENVAYTPIAGTPYQRVNLLLADPDNSESGAKYTERGFMQVSLCYPIGAGPAAAAARAILLRSTFAKGASFVASGVTVNIVRTPSIMPGMNDEDRYVVPVRIQFTAQITG